MVSHELAPYLALLCNFPMADTSEIPSPTLDIENSTLKWSHSFQPNLPQDFVLIQNTATILYTVYMTDKDNINTTLLSNTTSNSIDISDIIENCTGKNFNVKALISNNQLHSETSSSIIIFSGKYNYYQEAIYHCLLL